MADRTGETRINERAFETLALLWHCTRNSKGGGFTAAPLDDLVNFLAKQTARQGCHQARMSASALSHCLTRLCSHGLTVSPAPGLNSLSTKGGALADRLFKDSGLDPFHSKFLADRLNYKQMVVRRLLETAPTAPIGRATLAALMDDSGMSEQSVRNGLDNLRAAGVIAMDRATGQFQVLDTDPITQMFGTPIDESQVEIPRVQTASTVKAPDLMVALPAAPRQEPPTPDTTETGQERTLTLPAKTWRLLEAQADLHEQTLSTYLTALVRQQQTRMTGQS